MSAQCWREQSHATPQEHDAIREAANSLIQWLIAHPKSKGWQWGGVSS